MKQNMLRKKLYTDPSIKNLKRLRTEDVDTSNTPTDLSVSNFCDPLEISIYFPTLQPTFQMSIADKILSVQKNLNAVLRNIDFIKPPVQYVYNPVEYAFKTNETYIRKFCNTKKKIVFVGMNPGPFGMCQTGVPFGTVDKVRDWLQIQEEVLPPPVQCPLRPITGFNCKRAEISGSRFWGFFSELCGTPDHFFKHSFVYNYCPLAFMKNDGTNVTPPDIKDIQVRRDLEQPCDISFLEIINLLKPEVIIGIGVYAEKKVAGLLKTSDTTKHITLLRLAHPSQRAKNNSNWPEKARTFLEQNHLLHHFQRS